MIKKIIIISALIIIVIVLLSGMNNKIPKDLISPQIMQVFSKSTPTPTETPVPTPNAPKTFNFDSSTDLKAELEKVNPQVLDSDFQ